MHEGLLKDQVVLITGAGRPPAPALTAAFADQGAILAVNDLSPVLLDPLTETVQARGGRIQAYIADATRGMPLRAMLDEVLSDWGRIDILVNNPRIRPDAALLSMDEWDWQRTIEMNLNGPFLMTQLVARFMQEQGGGVILNIVDTDMLALEAPGRAAYAASQRALLALSRAAGRELMTYNIRVHALCPDQVAFRPGAEVFQAQQAAQQGQHIGGSNSSSIHDSAAGLSQLAVFLCSPAAAHLNGQVFSSNCSQTAAE